MSFLNIKREQLWQWRNNYHSPYKYYNFWRDERPEEMWFTRFIKHHFPESKRRVNFNSVLGPTELMSDKRPGVNIFYTGENIHAPRFEAHLKRYESQHYDFSMGFDFHHKGNYMRLPLWVLWCFPPEADRKVVEDIVETMNHPNVEDRKEFCCMVCSHDESGVRGRMMDAIERVGHVSSAGRFRYNTDALQRNFNDDKVAFMRQYRFVICPENADAEGYVTEKIFDSILAGCIPIYTGSGNYPEPWIINPKAVVFWDADGNHTNAVEKIKYLSSSDEDYLEFAQQPRLLPEAADLIWGLYSDLKQNLSELLK